MAAAMALQRVGARVTRSTSAAARLPTQLCRPVGLPWCSHAARLPPPAGFRQLGSAAGGGDPKKEGEVPPAPAAKGEEENGEGKEEEYDAGMYTLPNAITAGRIACSPIVGAIVNTPNLNTISRRPPALTRNWRLLVLLCGLGHAGWLICTEAYMPALVLGAVAASSDAVDGYIARNYNLTSKFGALLDPAADKIMILCLGCRSEARPPHRLQCAPPGGGALCPLSPATT